MLGNTGIAMTQFVLYYHIENARYKKSQLLG
jgi:hypothetical protein